jgi:mannose-6-phosphate isomerase class I
VAVVNIRSECPPPDAASPSAPAVLPLRADNFTPPTRTPWGGWKIVDKYKRDALPDRDKAAREVVGESWELSAGPEFPSCTESGVPLADILKADPVGMLGREAERGQASTALLVKWLDTGDNLSVQIHPPDDYPALCADETGKSECWYVVEHEPGAGIYFGFQPGVISLQVLERLKEGGDLSELLFFLPVRAGDLVVIEPGTAHALGKGITVIEPQYVSPGRRAVTYRYWDWNRRYDRSGQLQATGGKPRELHLEHALAVTAWDQASSDKLLKSCVLHAGPADTNAQSALEILCSQKASPGLACSRLLVARLVGNGTVTLPNWNVLRALTVIEGEVSFSLARRAQVIGPGRTVAIPARLGTVEAQLKQAHALLCAGQV